MAYHCSYEHCISVCSSSGGILYHECGGGHQIPGFFSCTDPDCDKMYDTAEHLVKHQRLTTHMLVETPGGHPCHFSCCAATFDTGDRLLSHMWSHSLPFPFYGCYWCTDRFWRRDDWRLHLQTHSGFGDRNGRKERQPRMPLHDLRPSYSCARCGEKAWNVIDAEAHQIAHHERAAGANVELQESYNLENHQTEEQLVAGSAHDTPICVESVHHDGADEDGTTVGTDDLAPMVSTGSCDGLGESEILSTTEVAGKSQGTREDSDSDGIDEVNLYDLPDIPGVVANDMDWDEIVGYFNESGFG